jgi:hypothetical protein
LRFVAVASAGEGLPLLPYATALRGASAATAQPFTPDQLGKGDVLTVTRLDRLARSTRDLLNTLAAITGNVRASVR